MDGTLATMKLEEAELGAPLPPQERQAMLRNMYGDLSSGVSTLLESPALASLEAASAASSVAAAAASTAVCAPACAAACGWVPPPVGASSSPHRSNASSAASCALAEPS